MQAEYWKAQVLVWLCSRTRAPCTHADQLDVFLCQQGLRQICHCRGNATVDPLK
jgi:hypothetical protein